MFQNWADVRYMKHESLMIGDLVFAIRVFGMVTMSLKFWDIGSVLLRWGCMFLFVVWSGFALYAGRCSLCLFNEYKYICADSSSPNAL
jgi:hypothetical protein